MKKLTFKLKMDNLIFAVLVKALKESFRACHDIPQGLIIWIGEKPKEDTLSLRYHDAHIRLDRIMIHVNADGFYGNNRVYHIEYNDYPEMYDRLSTGIGVPKDSKNIPEQLARKILIQFKHMGYSPTNIKYSIAPFE